MRERKKSVRIEVGMGRTVATCICTFMFGCGNPSSEGHSKGRVLVHEIGADGEVRVMDYGNDDVSVMITQEAGLPPPRLLSRSLAELYEITTGEQPPSDVIDLSERLEQKKAPPRSVLQGEGAIQIEKSFAEFRDQNGEYCVNFSPWFVMEAEWEWNGNAVFVDMETYSVEYNDVVLGYNRSDDPAVLVFNQQPPADAFYDDWLVPAQSETWIQNFASGPFRAQMYIAGPAGEIGICPFNFI